MYTAGGKKLGVLVFVAQYQALGHLSALTQQSHFQLATSAGTYGYVPNVTYFFGIPRSITPGGVEMDLDRVAHVSSVDGQGDETWKNFNFQLGALSSALEHAVPEQMFVTPENPGEAVSAVKALQKASQQGQRIYHITQANQAEALPNIRQNSLTMNEIRAALAVGKEVIVHTDPISVPGWSGAGYVIFDAETGAGAWKIGGGANGGMLQPDDAVDAISWLLSLLENVGQTSLLKNVGAFFSLVLDVVTAAIDTAKCGLAYAIAKYVAVSFFAAGVTFLVLPIVFIFLKVIFLKVMAPALIISSIIGATAGTAFSRRWSCE